MKGEVRMPNAYSPDLEIVMDIIDDDNGKGFNKNIPKKGQIFRLNKPGSNTRILYEVKIIDTVKIIFLRYIHYDNESELLKILAFAVKFWRNMKANMVYYREKDRDNGVGEKLTEIGFYNRKVDNNFEEFDCLRDGWPCNCNVYEYWIAGVK